MNIRESADALGELLRDYSAITLVANNPDIRLPGEAPGDGRTLYVFLNKAEPLKAVKAFDQDCLIISGRSGSSIFAVEGDRIPALQHIRPGRCKAIGVLVDRPRERPKLQNWDGAWLDVPNQSSWPYPLSQGKSTGFIALNHILDRTGQRPVVLLGFNGRSSTRRGLPSRHDWVYEQLFIRLLAENGRVTIAETSRNDTRDKVELLRRAFPEMSAEQFDRVLHSYAAEEISYLKAALHGIIRILKPITFFRKSLHFG